MITLERLPLLTEPLLHHVLALRGASGSRAFGKRHPNPSQVWRTHQQLHESQEFAELAASVEKLLKKRMLLLWANVLGKGQSVAPHHHRGNPGPLAGVFYLTGGSALRFPTVGVEVAPEPGLLVTFPSSLVHEVLPADSERVSLAFNAG